MPPTGGDYTWSESHFSLSCYNCLAELRGSSLSDLDGSNPVLSVQITRTHEPVPLVEDPKELSGWVGNRIKLLGTYYARVQIGSSHYQVLRITPRVLIRLRTYGCRPPDKTKRVVAVGTLSGHNGNFTMVVERMILVPRLRRKER